MHNGSHHSYTIRHIEKGDEGFYVINCQTNCWSSRSDIYVHNIQLHPFFYSNRTIPELGCEECLIGWKGELTEVLCVIGIEDLDPRFVTVSTVFSTKHILPVIVKVAVYLKHEPYINSRLRLTEHCV